MELKSICLFYKTLTDYQHLIRLQDTFNQYNVRHGSGINILISAEVAPVIDFGSVASKNKFSAQSLARIKSELGREGDPITPALIELLNASNLFDMPVYQSHRGGGATVFGPGQYLYFPVMEAPLEFKDSVVDRCAGFMRDVALNFLPADKVSVPDDAASVKIDGAKKKNLTKTANTYDLGFINGSRIEKFGSKGISLDTYGTGDRYFCRGGFSFNVKKAAIKNAGLVDLCGIPSSEIGVTSFEHILGRKMEKAEFDPFVLVAFKDNFYR